MNAQGVDLGDKLRDFKEQTKDLCTSLRGHYLSSNTFIRTIHNSFTRRMDHLNADLFLENQVSDASSKKKKQVVSRKNSRQRKTNKSEDYGFHFVAYVPAEGYVWELDGLKSAPQKIGEQSRFLSHGAIADEFCKRTRRIRRLDDRGPAAYSSSNATVCRDTARV